MTSQATPSVPASIKIRYRGTRNDIVHDNAWIEVLNQDHQADRDRILRIGREPSTFEFYEILIDDVPAARLTRDDSTWNAKLLDREGRVKGGKQPDPIARTETRRSSRKGKAKDTRLDPGSDLMTAFTAVINLLVPQLKTTTRTGGKPRITKKQMDTTIVSLLQSLADLQGMTLEESYLKYGKQYGISLSEDYFSDTDGPDTGG